MTKIKLSDLIVKNNNIDIDEYITFREKIKTKMEYPEWLGDFSKEDIIEMIANGSKLWMYYINNLPVCSMMLIPSTQESLDKFEVKNLSYKDVVDYGPMMVYCDYLGNGVQDQMLKEIDNYSKKQGYKYALGTIHPDNIYSINNLLKNNFIQIGLKEFKRGIRNIYYKELV